VRWRILFLFLAGGVTTPLLGQQYRDPDGRLRVALVKQPFSPTGTSAGPTTMAQGGIQQRLATLGATVRIDEAALTAQENQEYGGWKRLGMALGHFAELVERNEREGYFTVGLLATCPSMPGLVAGLQHSGAVGRPLRIGMLWLDAHPDFNTPETTRSGSLGGMPVAVATGRALHRMRLDAHLDPPLEDRHVVMGGVRLTDPLEQDLLDSSAIEQLSVDDLRRRSAAVFAQLDRLTRLTDKIYIHIDMDVLDPREVMGHQNKVPDGPSSEELARLFEEIFRRYPKASAIGFATIPATDEGGLSLAAVNRMIEGAIRGVIAREAGSAAPSPTTVPPAGQAADYSGPTTTARSTVPCRVTRIVDGDTIECAEAGRVRLIGIDSPERDQGRFGGQAAAALAELIPVGSRVQIEPDVDPRDRYGRVLGYLWRDNRLVNWLMVRRGWAVSATYPPNVQYVDRLTEAQRLARQEQQGLWAAGGFACLPADHRNGRC